MAKYLLSKKIINGIPINDNSGRTANGFGCLIAQYIRDFKTATGNLYVTDMDDRQ